MKFELTGAIWNPETIAAGPGVKMRERLRKVYGRGRWRKTKGAARIKLPNGAIRIAELHWYEAHSIGRRDLKIKRFLNDV